MQTPPLESLNIGLNKATGNTMQGGKLAQLRPRQAAEVTEPDFLSLKGPLLTLPAL